MAGMKDEEPEIIGAQVMYREWGRYLVSRQHYLDGIKYYEKSMEYGDENQIWTFVGLCKALEKAGHFRGAAKAAEEAIKIDPQHLVANLTRVEALFYTAEFGGSLVLAHQGVQRGNNRFKTMVLLNEEIVEDCVGANVPPDMLRRLLPWIDELFAHRAELFKRLNDEPDEFAGIDEDHSKFKVNDPAARVARRRKLLDQLVATIGLGASSIDKFYMQKMATFPDLKSANQAGSEQLKTAFDDCVSRLQRQQDVLWTRRPIYSINARMEAFKTPGSRLFAKKEFQLKKCLATHISRYLLRKVHVARLNRDYPMFFKWVEQARERIDSFSHKLVPARDTFLDTLFLMVARAYADPRNLMRHEDPNKKMAYLQRALGMKIVKLPRESDVAWPKTLNLRDTFAKIRERLALASRDGEILWLYHELGKLFIEVNRPDLARFYSKKIRDLAEPLGLEEWVMHANHIVLRIELSQNNRNEAKEAGGWCLENARKLGVPHLIDFYEKALLYIDALDFKNLAEEDNVTKRANLMSNLMPADLRPAMDLLLNTMNAVPAKRRLSVMPGCKPREYGGNKQTIRPGPPADYKREAIKDLLKKFSPKKGVLGYVDFDEFD